MYVRTIKRKNKDGSVVEYVQIDVWFWDTQIFKKRFGHLCVIMLAGVHQHVIDLDRISIHRFYDWHYFHEFRPGACYIKDFHFSSLFFMSASSRICSILWANNARS